MCEIPHVPPSYQLFESDQKTKLPGNRKKSEGLKETVGSLLSGLDRLPCKITQHHYLGLHRDRG